MATLRSLLTFVSTLYCFSVFIMLLHLPSIRYHLAKNIGHAISETQKPIIHSHILLHRIAEARCRNLSKRYHTSHSVNYSKIPNTEVSIMNAYLDRRKPKSPFIRLLVIMPAFRPIKLYCHVPMNGDSRIPASMYQFNENHGMLYGGYVFSCPLPRTGMTYTVPLCLVRVTEGSKTESGVEVFLENIPREMNKKRNISTCVPPLFGTIDPLRLIEFIELNRLLGIDHFYFYDYTATRDKELMKVFDHYVKNGVVTKLFWSLPVRSDKIWYGGQMLAIHHCLYLNMGVSKYTTFQDLDEAFVPRHHRDLLSLLADIDAERRHCGFRFFSAFFPSDNSDHNKLISLRKRRSGAISSVRTKCIVRSDLIFEMGIHHISKQNVEEKTPHNIPTNILILHHFRHCDRLYGMNCDDFVIDGTIDERYGEKLKENFNNTVRKLFIRST